MAIRINHQIQLTARPIGLPKASDFKLVEMPVASPGIGEMLTRTIYLSLDPYMRGRMSAGRSYARPVEVGEVMTGGTVSQVIESNLGEYTPGDFVLGINGWQEYALSDGSNTTKLDPKQAPISTAVGVLGMPGMSAHLGLLEIGKPKPGETVVVSTAAGAVGSCVGQIAKLKNCRTVGITGGPDKVRQCLEQFGYEHAIDYKNSADIGAKIAAACPSGVDVYFDNTCGPISDVVFRHLVRGARITVCGTASIQEWDPLPIGPRIHRQLLIARAQMNGFLVHDFKDRFPEAISQLADWIKEGKIVSRKHVLDGIEQAPGALQLLYRGENKGKLLIKLN